MKLFSLIKCSLCVSLLFSAAVQCMDKKITPQMLVSMLEQQKKDRDQQCRVVLNKQSQTQLMIDGKQYCFEQDETGASSSQGWLKYIGSWVPSIPTSLFSSSTQNELDPIKIPGWGVEWTGLMLGGGQHAEVSDEHHNRLGLFNIAARKMVVDHNNIDVGAITATFNNAEAHCAFIGRDSKKLAWYDIAQGRKPLVFSFNKAARFITLNEETTHLALLNTYPDATCVLKVYDTNDKLVATSTVSDVKNSYWVNWGDIDGQARTLILETEKNSSNPQRVFLLSPSWDNYEPKQFQFKDHFIIKNINPRDKSISDTEWLLAQVDGKFKVYDGFVGSEMYYGDIPEGVVLGDDVVVSNNGLSIFAVTTQSDKGQGVLLYAMQQNDHKLKAIHIDLNGYDTGASHMQFSFDDSCFSFFAGKNGDKWHCYATKDGSLINDPEPVAQYGYKKFIWVPQNLLFVAVPAQDSPVFMYDVARRTSKSLKCFSAISQETKDSVSIAVVQEEQAKRGLFCVLKNNTIGEPVPFVSEEPIDLQRSSFNKDGTLFATYGVQQYRVFDVGADKPPKSFKQSPDNMMRWFYFSPKGTYFITAGNYGINVYRTTHDFPLVQPMAHPISWTYWHNPGMDRNGKEPKKTILAVIGRGGQEHVNMFFDLRDK